MDLAAATCTLPNVVCLAPRGRFDLVLLPDALAFVSKGVASLVVPFAHMQHVLVRSRAASRCAEPASRARGVIAGRAPSLSGALSSLFSAFSQRGSCWRSRRRRTRGPRRRRNAPCTSCCRSQGAACARPRRRARARLRLDPRSDKPADFGKQKLPVLLLSVKSDEAMAAAHPQTKAPLEGGAPRVVAAALRCVPAPPGVHAGGM